MKNSFKTGDPVLSKSKWSLGKTGVVNKVSELGVHVKFIEKNAYGEKPVYEIFRHEKTHALHSGIEQLELITGESHK